MKLFLLFASVSLLLVLLQTTVLHLLPLGPLIPDLILILCVYWSLNYPSVGTVFGSFFLGYSVDVFSSPILGPNAFAMTLVFLAVYLSSRRIWIHNLMLSSAVVFFASWIKVAALILVWSFFLTIDGFWIGVMKYLMLEALLAAVLAPGIFSILRRGQNYLESTRGAI